jgi:hypothetical protein
MRVCVYCSSSASIAPQHLAAATELGTALGQRGDVLVWGGASVGLMGEVARAARAAGGRTEGIIPSSMLEREIADTEADELVVTEDMAARKAEMGRRSDAFVALPGGFGTLEELLEQLTLRLLELHTKPVVLVDIDGFWQPLLDLFEHFYRERVARPESAQGFTVAATVAAALTALDQPASLAPLPSKWL